MLRSLFSKGGLQLSEAELYSRLKSGEDIAFKVLYRQTFPVIKHFVLQNNGKESDAEDILQDGMIALWDNIRQDKYIRNDGVKISSYLSKVCKYRWLERLRSAGHKRNLSVAEHSDMEDTGGNALQQLISNEEINALESQFRKLGPKCQQILKLYYYEKKSMSEIAQILGMQPASVKNEKYRCMEKLKNNFDPTIKKV
jgi:RNA polymerase sigma factor (sigma-70 family)